MRRTTLPLRLEDRGPTRAFWRSHFEVWELSGLTQRDYCERHGLNLKNFGNWRGQLKREDAVGPKARWGRYPRLIIRFGGYRYQAKQFCQTYVGVNLVVCSAFPENRAPDYHHSGEAAGAFKTAIQSSAAVLPQSDQICTINAVPSTATRQESGNPNRQ
jgi:hypothetical protein